MIILGVLVFPFSTYAAGNCSQINGSSIYGYNGTKWEFIGSVTNQHSLNSIMSKYGTYGSEYSPKSVMDTYGIYGSKYSSTSAFNEYAANPPIIVSLTGAWGYLTTNQYKGSSISPYSAIACSAHPEW